MPAGTDAADIYWAATDATIDGQIVPMRARGAHVGRQLTAYPSMRSRKVYRNVHVRGLRQLIEGFDYVTLARQEARCKACWMRWRAGPLRRIQSTL